MRKDTDKKDYFATIKFNKDRPYPMIKNNHLRVLINGEEYWIPFYKGNKKKGEI